MNKTLSLVIFLGLIIASFSLSHKQQTNTTVDSTQNDTADPTLDDTPADSTNDVPVDQTTNDVPADSTTNDVPADSTQNNTPTDSTQTNTPTQTQTSTTTTETPSTTQNTPTTTNTQWRQSYSALQQRWGLSEAETNYQNISNLNAENWIVGDQTIDDYNKQLFTYITNNNVTKCPIKTPYLRGSDSQCIDCTGDKPVFDLHQKDCVACPEGTQLNTVTHQCEAAGPKAPSKCTANYVWNEASQKCVCPDAFPIDLGCECVTCLEPFVWNANEKVCKLRCQQTQVWNENTQTCECPKQSPYKVNGQCIACSAPFEWKADSNTCELKVSSCSAPSAPVSATPSTPSAPVQQPTPAPTTSTTPTTQTCTSNFVWDSNVQKCVCPADLPFNDGTKCVQCNLPQYWDHDLKQCLYCQGNKYFNTVSRSCESCPADKPLFRNYNCQACPQNTSYDAGSNTCQQEQYAFDPTATEKVPVYTTTTTPTTYN